ncbi:hypothetical protein AB0E01_35175 [Nocardia vinacea]|uniref:hypothetical protein n=1 Tax=Nocardia vinacea TaxID=96468 RepID=UPI003410BFB6
MLNNSILVYKCKSSGFLAELGLDGKLRPTVDTRTNAAITTAVTAATQARFRYAVLAAHLPVIEGITVVGLSTLREVLDWLHSTAELPPRVGGGVSRAVVSRDIHGILTRICPVCGSKNHLRDDLSLLVMCLVHCGVPGLVQVNCMRSMRPQRA